MKNDTVFVLLAGGKSKRMGVAKGLLKYQNTFWILEQLDRISKTQISTVYIGLGFNYQHYFDAVPWLSSALNKFVEFQSLKIKVVINPNPELGTFSTLQTVLGAIDSSCDVLLNHIDIPVLNSEEFNKIIEAKNSIVIPNYKGKNGHPVKMHFSFWKSLQTLNASDKAARLDIQIKKIDPTKISKIEVSDSSVVKNLNTKNDWISFLNQSL